MLAYRGRSGLSGYSEYALRSDGQWFVRKIPYTRTRSIGRPLPWRRVEADLALALALTKVINPDSPPSDAVAGWTKLHRINGFTARLPK